MKLSRMNAVAQRLLVGTGTIIAVFISVFLSTSPYFRPFFPILTAAFISTAVWEYCQMAYHKGYSPLSGLSIIGTVLYVFGIFFSTQTPFAHAFPQIALFITLTGTFLYYFFKGRNPLVNTAITLFPIAYLAIPLSCIISINYFHFTEGSPVVQDGRLWLFYAAATTKMSDIGGYFFGKQIGRRLLSPMISPNKTWEGAIGGLCCAVLTSYLFTYVVELGVATSIILGVIIALLAQFGDLAESLLKRDTGFKDSSHIPGLGGSLDMVDSLVFTLPFVYLFLVLTYGAN